MLKIIPMILIIIVLLGSLVYGIEDIIIHYNNQQINLDQSPIAVGNSLLLPLEEYFNLLNIKYSIDSDNGVIKIFKDNVYIKAFIDEKSYWVNGKKCEFDHAPVIVLGKLFISSTINEFLSINQLYNSSNNSLDLLSKSNNFYFTGKDNENYYSIDYTPNDLSLQIPITWKRLTESSYGFNDETILNLSINKINLNESPYTIVNNTPLTQDAVLIITKINEMEFIKQKFKDELNETIVYYTQLSDEVIQFKFVSNLNAPEYFESISSHIMNSIYVKDIYLDTDAEHYYEFESAQEMNLNISTQIYSNMKINNYFKFSGTIDNSVDIIYGKVSKDGEYLDFEINVENGYFDSKINAPFGLGKHDISLALNENGFNNTKVQLLSENQLINFSIINISEDDIRYIVPSKYIPSDNHNILSVVNSLKNNSKSNYAITQIIYNYILNNYNSNNEINLPLDVYKAKSGTDEGINSIMTTFLRAAGVPAKLVYKFSNLDYFTGVFINNRWFYIDPYMDIVKEKNTLIKAFNTVPIQIDNIEYIEEKK